MKKNTLWRVCSICLCAVLLCGAAGATAYAASARSGESQPAPQPVAASMEKAEEASAKDETVYVIAGADGTVERIIVSDWLKNAQGSGKLEDVSDLTGIQNVKGDEGCTVSGGSQIWDAQGRDIYYQGSIEKELPVTMTVSYTLDGQTITPEELAGKSGHVVIRFDYRNNQYETVTIDGKQEKIYVPFAVLTGLLLDNDRFTNVEVSNGKLINDGDRIAVAALAFPGLQEDLALDSDQLEIPGYVEVSADVKDFALANTVTIVTNELFNEMDRDTLEDLGVERLTDSLDEMTGAMSRLIDGSSQLYDGLCALLEGADELSGGIGQLADGLNTLSANSASLNAGSMQVFEALLSTADAQLAAAGLELPQLTIDNYSQVLSGVLGSLDEAAVTGEARGKVEQAVRAQEDAVRQAVTAAVEQEVTAQVQAAVRANVEEQVLAAMDMTPEAYAAAVSAGAVSQAQQAQITSAVDKQMAGAAVKASVSENAAVQMQSAEIAAMIDSKTEEQIQALVDQNMASDEVQAQIAAGLEQANAGAASIRALKVQLDSYSAFYQGLLAYTGGVDAAAAGANQLDAAAPALMEGAAELRDGAMQLTDGLREFNEEGVQKLADAVNGDLSGLADRLQSIADVSQNYRNFSGILQDMDGQVRFVYRTGSVEAPAGR